MLMRSFTSTINGLGVVWFSGVLISSFSSLMLFVLVSMVGWSFFKIADGVLFVFLLCIRRFVGLAMRLLVGLLL